MPLKAALATILTALMLAAALAVPGFARSGPDQPPPPARSGQSSPAGASQSAAGGTIPYQNVPLGDIRFPGLSDADLERMQRMIPLKTGQRLDRDLVRQSIQILNATGRYSDIRVEAERVSNGQVSLAFVTQPNYFIGMVNVEGAPGPPAANQVANASKLQLGELFTAEKLAPARDSIRRLMEENGYYLSRLSEEEKKHPETQQVDIFFTLVPGARAQVGRVSATGDFSYSQKQIQDIAKLHPGDAVSVQRVSGALDRLRNKFQKRNRLLAQVAISSRTYRPEINAVDYLLAITPGPKVDLSTEGFRISRSVLRKNVPIYEEGALDDDLLNEGRRNLLNYLQARGYFEAKVTLDKKSSPSGDQLRVLYDIDAGSRHKLAKVEIVGNTWFVPQEKLLEQLQLQPANRLFTQGRYSQGLLNQDIRSLEAVFRDSGFPQVKVTSRVADNYEGRGNQIAVTLIVDQGPQTLVSEFHVEGNQKVSEGQFPPLNTVPGQPYAESNIAADRDILLNYYLNRGFPDATFEAAAQADSGSPDRMNVVYTIHEGEQVFVDRAVLAGLVHTRPLVVQREVQVKPGGPVSQIDMLKTQQNLYSLLIFSQVNTAVQNPEGKEQYKNVLVDVQEAKRYTFKYGLGLEFQTGQPVGTNQPLGATGVSPRVSFGVTRLNFRGRNQTLTFKANVGRLQQRGLLSFEAPRLLNSRNWILTLTTFYDNTLDVNTFTSQRLEGTAQAEQTISRRPDGSPSLLVDYRFTYRRVKAIDPVISPDQIPLLSQPTRVGMPNFSFIRNKRDNDLESTRGSYTTFNGGVADSHFASEADFGRVLVQNSTYYAFGKNRPGSKKYVIARSTRIGVETPFGNTIMPLPGLPCPTTGETACLPLAERFFTGGGNSHRGFGLNQAGPRDPITGFPLGGTALFLNNLELRLPPPTLRFFQQNLSFTLFQDVGNVFTNGDDMLHSLVRWRQKNPQLCLVPATPGEASQCDFNYVSHAIGVGVRYKTPVGPVRFDFGYNLNPPAFPSCQSNPGTPGEKPSASCPANAQFFVPQRASHFNFSFSIGQTF